MMTVYAVDVDFHDRIGTDEVYVVAGSVTTAAKRARELARRLWRKKRPCNRASQVPSITAVRARGLFERFATRDA